jgi:hypothetical protein
LMTAVDEKGDKAMMVNLQQWVARGQKMYKEQMALTLPIVQEALQLSTATQEEILADKRQYGQIRGKIISTYTAAHLWRSLLNEKSTKDLLKELEVNAKSLELSYLVPTGSMQVAMQEPVIHALCEQGGDLWKSLTKESPGIRGKKI